MAHEFANFIMERRFESLDANGNVGTILLRIGQPYLKPEANTRAKWRCPLQITGSSIDRSMKAPGSDSIESVLMSLRLAQALLEDHSQKKTLKITWQGEEDLGLWLYPSPDAAPSDEKRAKFDFEEVFNEFFRTFGKNS